MCASTAACNYYHDGTGTTASACVIDDNCASGYCGYQEWREGATERYGCCSGEYSYHAGDLREWCDSDAYIAIGDECEHDKACRIGAHSSKGFCEDLKLGPIVMGKVCSECDDFGPEHGCIKGYHCARNATTEGRFTCRVGDTNGGYTCLGDSHSVDWGTHSGTGKYCYTTGPATCTGSDGKPFDFITGDSKCVAFSCDEGCTALE